MESRLQCKGRVMQTQMSGSDFAKYESGFKPVDNPASCVISVTMTRGEFKVHTNTGQGYEREKTQTEVNAHTGFLQG